MSPLAQNCIYLGGALSISAVLSYHWLHHLLEFLLGHFEIVKMSKLFAVIFAVTLHLSNSQGVDKLANATTNSTSAPAPATNETALPTPENATTPIPPSGNSTLKSGNPTPLPSNSSKLICYYNKLSLNRSESLKYSLADVDSSLCTHVIYSFVTLDPTTLKIQNDSLGQDYESVVALKEKGIVVMVSLGGRLDSLDSEKYSKMVRDGNSRKDFVDSTVHFLKKYKFQGLDLNWDYPLCWNGNCKAGRPADRANFGNLVRELRIAFHYYKFLLSVAVSPLESISDKAYNIPVIAQNADWINLMTFDYNNITFTSTAMHSPFQGHAPNSVTTVEYWKSKGTPASKLILGVPTFGRTFTLAREMWNVTGAPAAIGKPTGLNEPGLAAYFEVCTGLDYQYMENVGPYAHKGDQWVSFDDVTSVKVKGEYIRKNELGGALIYSLDTDDFSGKSCGQGKYPLINALKGAMSGH